MLPRVNAVRYIKDFELELGFTDGTVACLDFRDRIVGRSGVFAHLQDTNFFKLATIDPEAGTLVWPNGVDFCPDVLYAEATGTQIAALSASVDVA